VFADDSEIVKKLNELENRIHKLEQGKIKLNCFEGLNNANKKYNKEQTRRIRRTTKEDGSSVYQKAAESSLAASTTVYVLKQWDNFEFFDVLASKIKKADVSLVRVEDLGECRNYMVENEDLIEP
jgi:hypothetical protein